MLVRIMLVVTVLVSAIMAEQSKEGLLSAVSNPSAETFSKAGFADEAEAYTELSKIGKVYVTCKQLPTPNGIKFNLQMIGSDDLGPNCTKISSYTSSFCWKEEIVADPDAKLSEDELQSKYFHEVRDCYDANELLLLSSMVYCKNNNLQWTGKVDVKDNNLSKGFPVLSKAVKTVFGRRAKLTPWKMGYIFQNFDNLWTSNEKFRKEISLLRVSQKVTIQ